jgi:cbb3-type cytochrome oxidase subunit 3
VKKPQTDNENITVMYKNVLQSIENIAIWPVISFVIFFLFFICLLWWVLTTDRKFIQEMEAMPLDQRAEQQNVNNQTDQQS